ncbi:hypothetical protein CEXT_465821 [Caerostris extrusa]|uniref:Uncharacterized protein n=1 Tax=Caerostris extrusa TaxID=172846 RepID=A0AAV4PTM4_CAEEX|nr:hypothetical protein CEXT_465821 [Caerostris extrusa]
MAFDDVVTAVLFSQSSAFRSVSRDKFHLRSVKKRKKKYPTDRFRLIIDYRGGSFYSHFASSTHDIATFCDLGSEPPEVPQVFVWLEPAASRGSKK